MRPWLKLIPLFIAMAALALAIRAGRGATAAAPPRAIDLAIPPLSWRELRDRPLIGENKIGHTGALSAGIKTRF